jgi:hypothetical protein
MAKEFDEKDGFVVRGEDDDALLANERRVASPRRDLLISDASSRPRDGPYC